MQNSRAFSEMMPADGADLMAQSMTDFADLEDENAGLRQELEQMERIFSQTDNEFFNKQREALEMESQFETVQQQAEQEISRLVQVVEAKEQELLTLQRHL